MPATIYSKKLALNVALVLCMCSTWSMVEEPAASVESLSEGGSMNEEEVCSEDGG